MNELLREYALCFLLPAHPVCPVKCVAAGRGFERFVCNYCAALILNTVQKVTRLEWQSILFAMRKQIGDPEIYGNEYGLRGQTFRINAETGQVALGDCPSPKLRAPLK